MYNDYKITDKQLQITNYGLRITNYELRITNYGLSISNISLSFVIRNSQFVITNYSSFQFNLSAGENCQGAPLFSTFVNMALKDAGGALSSITN